MRDLIISVQALEPLLVYYPTDKEQKQIEKLFDEILKKKKSKHDTTSLEKEIDVLVYKLYELTYDEVKIIDKDFWLSEDEYLAKPYPALAGTLEYQWPLHPRTQPRRQHLPEMTRNAFLQASPGTPQSPTQLRLAEISRPRRRQRGQRRYSQTLPSLRTSVPAAA